MTAPLESAATAGFAGSRARFETVLGWLESAEAGTLEHAELEAHLQADARELFRQLYQDHLDLRAEREPRIAAVADAEGVGHGSAEPGHTRGLATVFGPVQVTRIAYRARGQANLHPADGGLNLPADRYSHGLRRLAAIEAARGSFDGAVEAIERGTGQQVGKRQVEELAQRSVADFDAFYSGRQPPAGSTGDALVLSCDGKGVVMRPDALRAATAAAAAKTSPKLATRLSKGEKRNRKRMAEVGTVYDATPTPRTPADILPATEEERREAAAGPVPANKWLMASVVEDAASVVGRIFDEAERRDPEHQRTWVALVDGNNHQIDRIGAEARARKVSVSVVIDLIHVLEYLWKAAWCCHAEGDPAAAAWVRHHALGCPRREVHPGGRRDPACRHDGRARPRQTGRRRCRRHLPDQQVPVPGLPDRAGERLADRHRSHRRRLLPPGQRPDGPHRRPLGTQRCRGHPQAPRASQQQRLRRLLALPPRPGTPPRSPVPLRRPRHSARGVRPLQKSRTHLKSRTRGSCGT